MRLWPGLPPGGAQGKRADCTALGLSSQGNLSIRLRRAYLGPSKLCQQQLGLT